MGDSAGNYKGPPCTISVIPVDTRVALESDKTAGRTGEKTILSLPDNFPSFLPPDEPEPEQ